MPVFPSNEWIEALQVAANKDPKFIATCKKWPDDIYILVCEEDDRFEETICYVIEIDEEGIACVEQIDSPLDADADFIIAAPYSVWKKAIQSREPGATFLLRGEITVEGNKEELLRRAKESQDLVRLLSSVETTFTS